MPGYTLQDGLTLKNKLGARSHQALGGLEGDHVTSRVWELERKQGPNRQFDVAHLKAIHRHLFQDVYEWAGRTRDERVKLSDGTIASEPVLRKVGGQPFMDGPLIAGNLKRITGKLCDENYLRGLGREEFSNRAATLLVELAQEAGQKLDFSCVSRERMIQASISGNEKNDPAMMQQLFSEIGDPVRVAALSKAIGSLSNSGFAWNNHYIATTEGVIKLMCGWPVLPVSSSWRERRRKS